MLSSLADVVWQLAHLIWNWDQLKGPITKHLSRCIKIWRMSNNANCPTKISLGELPRRHYGGLSGKSPCCFRMEMGREKIQNFLNRGLPACIWVSHLKLASSGGRRPVIPPRPDPRIQKPLDYWVLYIIVLGPDEFISSIHQYDRWAGCNVVEAHPVSFATKNFERDVEIKNLETSNVLKLKPHAMQERGWQIDRRIDALHCQLRQCSYKDKQKQTHRFVYPALAQPHLFLRVQSSFS